MTRPRPARLHRPVAGPALLAALAPDGSKFGERLFVLTAIFVLGRWLAGEPGLLSRLGSSWEALLALPMATAPSAHAVGAGQGEFYDDPVLFGPAAVGPLADRGPGRPRPASRASGASAPLASSGRPSLVLHVPHVPITFLVIGAAPRADLTVAPGGLWRLRLPPWPPPPLWSRCALALFKRPDAGRTVRPASGLGRSGPDRPRVGDEG